jgi:carbon starvation protein
MGKLKTALIFGAIAILGAVSLAVIALHQGESISAVWIVVAALCVYAIAYRFYARYLAGKVLGLNARRPTPAVRHNDGLDYVPTPRNVLFGHHFAAIAGAGPLVGPVLAAQMGYLPGVLWILVGAVLAGAVQDMIVLFMSTRRDGRSLGDMVRTEMGPIPGVIAQVGVLMIMVIILAVLALVVVKALAESPVGHLHRRRHHSHRRLHGAVHPLSAARPRGRGVGDRRGAAGPGHHRRRPYRG